jgi:hypothetical protein
LDATGRRASANETAGLQDDPDAYWRTTVGIHSTETAPLLRTFSMIANMNSKFSGFLGDFVTPCLKGTTAGIAGLTGSLYRSRQVSPDCLQECGWFRIWRPSD